MVEFELYLGFDFLGGVGLIFVSVALVLDRLPFQIVSRVLRLYFEFGGLSLFRNLDSVLFNLACLGKDTNNFVFNYSDSTFS